ncbi:hypothetical protein G6F35_017902 [Rhizopus arrhizus]|nr:hypothetical protein G6F35_017902 [Rhizopus arrhizus]
MLPAAISRTLPQGRRITATIHEGQGPALLRQLRDHTLDIVVGAVPPATAPDRQPPPGRKAGPVAAGVEPAGRPGLDPGHPRQPHPGTGGRHFPARRPAAAAAVGAKRFLQADRGNDRGKRPRRIHPARRHRG